jgi:hypothetical protein
MYTQHFSLRKAPNFSPNFSPKNVQLNRSIPELESKHEFVVKVRDLVKTWPRPIFIVMRYIFAFLNHLSEYR